MQTSVNQLFFLCCLLYSVLWCFMPEYVKWYFTRATVCKHVHVTYNISGPLSLRRAGKHFFTGLFFSGFRGFVLFPISYKDIVQNREGGIHWVPGINYEVYRFGLQFLLFEKVITILRYAKQIIFYRDTESNYLQNWWGLSFPLSFVEHLHFFFWHTMYLRLVVEKTKHLNNEHLYKQGGKLLDNLLWTGMRSNQTTCLGTLKHIYFTPTSRCDPYF